MFTHSQYFIRKHFFWSTISTTRAAFLLLMKIMTSRNERKSDSLSFKIIFKADGIKHGKVRFAYLTPATLAQYDSWGILQFSIGKVL